MPFLRASRQKSGIFFPSGAFLVRVVGKSLSNCPNFNSPALKNSWLRAWTGAMLTPSLSSKSIWSKSGFIIENFAASSSSSDWTKLKFCNSLQSIFKEGSCFVYYMLISCLLHSVTFNLFLSTFITLVALFQFILTFPGYIQLQKF